MENKKVEQKIPCLALIVPCYNEEEIIEHSVTELNKLFQAMIDRSIIHEDSFMYFVNDGSVDNTLKLLLQLKKNYQRLKVINLTKNFGHQAALLSGLNSVIDKCDCAISIDADLQDDISVLEEMIKKFNLGSEIVYGVRKARKTDSFVKRFTAKSFYRFMALAGVKLVYNHADYRLMSNRAIKHLSSFKEVNLFLRGLIPEIGLQTSSVYYDRKIRIAGETKYPLKKMLTFAFEGISSFSVMPLRLMIFIGFIIISISIVMGIFVLIAFIQGAVIQGWASTVLSIWFLGGVQLFGLGIIGEYTGKVYKETKQRPIYFIDQIFE